MLTYHSLLIGFVLSKTNKRDYFSKELNKFAEYIDYNVYMFDIDSFEEYIQSKTDNNDDDNYFNVEQEKEMVKHFIQWFADNTDSLTIEKGYNGASRETPFAIKFKEELSFNCFKDDSYTITVNNLKEINEKTEKFKNFCKESMTKELFDFFEKRDDFGLECFYLSN